MGKLEKYEAVPEAKTARSKFNYEIGAKMTQDKYFGTGTSKKCSSSGGNIVQRLMKITDEQIIGRR